MWMIKMTLVWANELNNKTHLRKNRENYNQNIRTVVYALSPVPPNTSQESYIGGCCSSFGPLKHIK